eukprot:gene8211-5736_t
MVEEEWKGSKQKSHERIMYRSPGGDSMHIISSVSGTLGDKSQLKSCFVCLLFLLKEVC